MLEVKGLTKNYHGKPVLRDVSFSLSAGECLGVAGHNGSGKSTLLAIVGQVTAPDAGQILCDGADVMGDRQFMCGSVGYVPQNNSLLPDLTVQETLRFWQQTYHLGHLELFSPNSPCTMLGLEKIAKKRVGALSGGMQKRLSMALALLHSPRFLLMDEALPALDRQYRSLLFHWLNRAKALGTALLYCSHEVEELRDFCDTILVLRDGQTAFYGPAAAFPTLPKTLDSMMNPAMP